MSKHFRKIKNKYIYPFKNIKLYCTIALKIEYLKSSKLRFNKLDVFDIDYAIVNVKLVKCTKENYVHYPPTNKRDKKN